MLFIVGVVMLGGVYFVLWLIKGVVKDQCVVIDVGIGEQWCQFDLMCLDILLYW